MDHTADFVNPGRSFSRIGPCRPPRLRVYWLATFVLSAQAVLAMPIRCLIVDDEAPARDELRYLLSSFSEIEILGEASSAGQAISLINRLQPDLVFLDIQMPGANGFEVIRSVRDQDTCPLFVFTTAYDAYAVRAFEASAIDYLLKPLSSQRLGKTMERISTLLAKPTRIPLNEQLESMLHQLAVPGERAKISVEQNGRMRLLPLESIVFCRYRLQRILVHTFDECLPIYGISTMDRLENHLSGSSFFRAHRSTLVNLDQVSEFSPWFNGKYTLTMADAARTELTLSRSRVPLFKQRLGI
jgi:DNA-binding LytR/AlgR family response regulator